MITIIATFSIKLENLKQFHILIDKLMQASRKEDLCLRYDLYEDTNDKQVLTLIEEWDGEEAIQLHNAMPYYIEIAPKLSELCSKSPEVRLYRKLS
jgi:quinol monooxygenase YgiN